MDTEDWLILGGAIILMYVVSRQGSALAAIFPGLSTTAAGCTCKNEVK